MATCQPSGCAARSRRTGRRIQMIGGLGLSMLTVLLLTAGQASALPPGYGFEKVSPDAIGKNDADVPSGLGTIRVSTDGKRATWMESAATSGDEGAPVAAQALGVLRADGWAVRGISPPLSADEGGASALNNAIGYQSFSPNLDQGVFMQGGPPLVPGAADEQGMRNLYLRELTGGFGYQLVTPPPINSLTLKDTLFGLGTVQYSPKIADASPDYGTFVFETNFLPLAPGAAEGNGGPTSFGKPSVYLWKDGQVETVSLLENGEAPSDGAVAGAGINAGVFGGNSKEAYMPGIMSDDGRKVFFTVSTGPSTNLVSGSIYVRIDGTTTQEVSKSQLASPEEPQPALFVTSSKDGRYAFFSSEERLTEDSTASPAVKRDLYRYDVETEELIDLTAALPADGSHSYEGTIGVSDDGLTVYVLVGSKGYIWHEGTIERLTSYPGNELELLSNTLNETLSRPNSEVSRDGRWALVQSTAEITGQSTGDVPQLFLYDRETKEMTCISCPASGVPSGGAYTTPEVVFSTFVMKNQYRARVLSDDGSRITFQTATRLTADDRNAAVDVYQYLTDTGELQLLSSGTGTAPSYVGDISADGKSVFFVTRQRLVPEDKDDLADLYVARPGGSGGKESVIDVVCSGEACQGPLPAPPARSVAGSAGIAGPGNAKHKRGKKCGKQQMKGKGSKAGKRSCGKKKPGKSGRQAKRKAAQGMLMDERTVESNRRMSR